MKDEGGATVGTEQRYTDDARRWLRAYPPRWRVAREEEVLGVLLDTRPPDASKLDGRTRRDLVRGGLVFRWRSHPPFLQWLMWRWFDVVPGPAHRAWVADDLAGRFYGVRDSWLGLGGLGVGLVVLTLSDFGRDLSPWTLLPLVVFAVLSLLPLPWNRRRAQQRLFVLMEEERLAHGFDGSLPWTFRTRYAWSHRVLLPVAGAVTGAVVAAGVLALWWTDPGARAVASDLGLWPLPLTESGAAFVPMALVASFVVPFPVVALAFARRRVRSRPQQPWRSAPRPLPGWPVLVVTGIAFSVPVAAVVLPAWTLGVSAEADTSPGSPVSDTAFTLVGLGVVLVPAAVFTLLVAVMLLVGWVRVARALRETPGPPLALVDVLDVRGGDRVAVDPPVLLRPQGYAPYPAAGPGPAPGRPH